MWEFFVSAPNRLDRALREQGFPGAVWLSRQGWDALFEAGRVTVNGRMVKKSGVALAAGDQVAVQVPGPLGLLPSGPSVEVVWHPENQNWGIFAKPSEVDTLAILPWDQSSFASRLAAYAEAQGLAFASLAEPPSLEGGLVQRLDRDTSGLLCAAFTAEAKAKLRGWFAEGLVEKCYFALVTAPVVAGEARIWFLASHGPRVRATAEKPRGDAEEATLTLRIAARSARATLVEVRTRQGRRHVVRAGMAALGAPLAGDGVYEGAPLAPFHQLHAAALSFPEAPGRVEVAPPQGFLDSCARLGIEYPG